MKIDSSSISAAQRRDTGRGQASDRIVDAKRFGPLGISEARHQAQHRGGPAGLGLARTIIVLSGRDGLMQIEAPELGIGVVYIQARRSQCRLSTKSTPRRCRS